MTASGGKDVGRRRFFRQGLGRFVGSLADYLDRRLGLPTVRSRLRPPGAIAEANFLDTCYRCGTCAAICPAGAISTWAAGDERATDTPVIDPDSAACVLCDGLKCTHECPSGALLPVTTPQQVAMGLAKVNAMVCVRSTGGDCAVCVERCPIGGGALRLIGPGAAPVVEGGCVGCGVCHLHCPSRPKAIMVSAR